MTDPNRPHDWEATSRYSPPPQQRPAWPQADASQQPRTPERWLEPATAVGPQEPRRRRREGPSIAVLLFVSLLSALLAAGGTYLALGASGALSGTGQTPQPAGSPLSQQGGGATGGDTGASPSPTAPAAPAQGGGQASIEAAASRVGPAVVTITTGGAREGTNPFDVPETGVGSGFIYNRAGWILTNRHVVCGSSAVRVRLADGRTFAGRVYGIDSLTDLAIVKVEGANLPVAPIGDSSGLRQGQLAVAIGSPLGEYTNTVTSGIISALGRDINVNPNCPGQPNALRNLVQTDAPINPGNSGGPLVDAAGRVIGVNTAAAGRAQGIGFAIPINVAKPIMEQAVAGQRLTRPWIGIYYDEVDPELVRTERLPIDYGLLVTRGRGAGAGDSAVVPDSPADRAGIQDGDIITAANGQRLDAGHSLDEMLIRFKPGDQITLSILRDGRTHEVRVTLGTRPTETS